MVTCIQLGLWPGGRLDLNDVDNLGESSTGGEGLNLPPFVVKSQSEKRPLSM